MSWVVSLEQPQCRLPMIHDSSRIASCSVDEERLTQKVQYKVLEHVAFLYAHEPLVFLLAADLLSRMASAARAWKTL
eukprot:1622784-Amphidinium_carterae.1